MCVASPFNTISKKHRFPMKLSGRVNNYIVYFQYPMQKTFVPIIEIIRANATYLVNNWPHNIRVNLSYLMYTRLKYYVELFCCLNFTKQRKEFNI